MKKVAGARPEPEAFEVTGSLSLPPGGLEPSPEYQGMQKTSNFISKCYHMLIKIEGKWRCFLPHPLQSFGITMIGAVPWKA